MKKKRDAMNEKASLRLSGGHNAERHLVRARCAPKAPKATPAERKPIDIERVRAMRLELERTLADNLRLARALEDIASGAATNPQWTASQALDRPEYATYQVQFRYACDVAYLVAKANLGGEIGEAAAKWMAVRRWDDKDVEWHRSRGMQL